jgi:hypothetical protein
MSFNVHEQLESGIVTDDFARKSFTAFQFWKNFTAKFVTHYFALDC